MRLYTRAIRPNGNDAAGTPASVGPDVAVPGDPHGVEIAASEPPTTGPPPVIRPSAWSGWPAEWDTPNWSGHRARLTATAWMCIDRNTSILATMPPYLVGAAPSLDAEWLRNPNPDIYTSWEEFAKQLFWDYYLGEAFVYADAAYASGWPARFHVLPPWAVEVEFGSGGQRVYRIGRELQPPGRVLHLRYQSTVDDAHGHGPLEAGGAVVTAADVLTQYGTSLAAGGGIPPSVLTHPDELSAEQAADLKAQWVAARLSGIGEPAVLSGGVAWQPTQVSPKDMALVELLQFSESRIAVLLGVPPFLVGLPSGGDSMTYKNVASMADFHWRAGLRPVAASVTAGLSEWLLPRGTTVEVNRDAYVQAEPLERAQTEAILNGIKDEFGRPAMTVDEIREVERLDTATEGGLVSGPVGT